MAIISISSELPLPAAQARAAAAVPEVMLFVLAPVLSFDMSDAPPPGTAVTTGFSASGRVWWFGVIPSWMHRITVQHLTDTEIYTCERGGPVTAWNHRLTFIPIDDDRCRYTDAIEIEDGFRGIMTGMFVRAMFRHRHRRWRLLAATLGAVRAAD